MSEFHPAGYRAMALAFADLDTRDLLPRIRVPTLLLWGAEDRRSPVSVAEQMRAAIPGARLEVMPGTGHVSSFERPEAFNRHVREFCHGGAHA
jgi:pimeloyl-ACP methyl ester carboxylesterase